MTERSCALAALELFLVTKDARSALREFKSTKNEVLGKKITVSDLTAEKSSIQSKLAEIHESCAEREVLQADLESIDQEIKELQSADIKSRPKPTVEDLEAVRVTLDREIVRVQAALATLGKCGVSVTKTINKGQRSRTMLETVVKSVKTGGEARKMVAERYTGRDVMGFLNKIARDVIKENTAEPKSESAPKETPKPAPVPKPTPKPVPL